jgi:hypothetical protein
VLLVRFFHYLGIAMWLGGWLAAAVVASGSHGNSQQVSVRLTALLTRVHTMIIAPGAVLTVGSGILWSMAIGGVGGVESRIAPIGAWIMTVLGVLGGLLVAFVALPTALKLKSVAVTRADGQVLPVFEKHKMRLEIVSAVGGLCALASLFAAVLAP